MKKRPKRYLLTYLWTFPWDILSWLAVLFLWLLWGTKLHWLEGLWFELKEKSWPMRTWYKGWNGTCFGHGGFYAPGVSGGEGVDTATEYHERIHSEQYEAAMLVSLIFGVVAGFVLWSLQYPEVALWTGGIMWIVGGLLHTCAAFFQAWIRGENPYRGSTNEESAYSQTREWEENKEKEQ